MLMDMSLLKCDIYQGKELQVILRDTKALELLIFFKKKFCLIPGLKFTLSGVTSFLPDNLSELTKIIVRPEAIT